MPEKEFCVLSYYSRSFRPVLSAVFADHPAKMERLDYDEYWLKRGKRFFPPGTPPSPGMSPPEPASWLRLLFGRFPVQWQLHPGRHLRFRTIKDFKPWLEAQGFKVAEIKVHSGFSGLCRIWPNLFADSSVFIVRRKERDGA